MALNTQNLTLKSNLRIIFWNARSVIKQKEELQTFLQDVDILVCVESWLNENKSFQFPGFVSFRKDRPSSTGGGIVLLIRKNIAYKEIDNLATPNLSVELCGLRITNTNPALSIYVCYRVPGDTLSQEQWEVVFSIFNLGCNDVFLGDFNAHHELWNCRKTDLNGKYLLECVKKAKFFIHNTDMINSHRQNLEV